MRQTRTPAAGQVLSSPTQLLSLGVEGGCAKVMILLEDYTGGKDKLSCQNLVSSKPPAQQPAWNSGTTPSGCADAPPRKKSRDQSGQE